MRRFGLPGKRRLGWWSCTFVMVHRLSVSHSLLGVLSAKMVPARPARTPSRERLGTGTIFVDRSSGYSESDARRVLEPGAVRQLPTAPISGVRGRFPPILGPRLARARTARGPQWPAQPAGPVAAVPAIPRGRGAGPSRPATASPPAPRASTVRARRPRPAAHLPDLCDSCVMVASAGRGIARGWLRCQEVGADPGAGGACRLQKS